MKPYATLLILLTTLPPTGIAQEQITLPPPQNQTQPQQQLEPDNSRTTETQWCVYADRRYTRGAVITIRGQDYLCVEEVDSDTGQPRLVWRSAG